MQDYIHNVSYPSKATEVVTAVVESVSVSDEGLVSIDVVDSTGEYFAGVRIIGTGGSVYSWSNFPIRVNQHVTLIKTGEHNFPVCIGSGSKILSEEDISYKPTTNGATIVNSSSDITETYLTDWSILNNTNQLSVTENNGVVVKSPQNIRLQLSNDALFRISKNGLTVDNPLNAQQFIEALFSYLAVLEAKVLANSAVLGVVGADAATQATARAAIASGLGDAATATIETNKSADITTKTSAATVPLSTTSATTKTSCEGTKNENILLP
jgi:hypothetical protein